VNENALEGEDTLETAEDFVFVFFSDFHEFFHFEAFLLEGEFLGRVVDSVDFVIFFFLEENLTNINRHVY